MISDVYDPDRNYGIGLDFILSVAKKREKNNDDFFLINIGARSTGKSMLMLHTMEKYLQDKADMELIGLHKGDFANALYKASSMSLPRMCVNDEGNLSSKEVMSKYNRAIMDTYYSIRGMNIFHEWCNPSLDGIDKRFIKEIINGIIFTYTKHKNVRFYYYFTKKSILKILEKEGNLELPTLKKNAKKYAHHKGWFKDYLGVLRADYLKKKDGRMVDKVKEFRDDWGSDENMITQIKIAKELGVSRSHVCQAKKRLEAKNKLGDDVIINIAGTTKYPLSYIEIFKEEMIEHGKKKTTNVA